MQNDGKICYANIPAMQGDQLSDCPLTTVIVQSRICPFLATISASCMLSSHVLTNFPNTQLQLHSEFDTLSSFF